MNHDDNPGPLCARRTRPAGPVPGDARIQTHFVNFRKPEHGRSCTRIEVAIHGPRRHAVALAKKLVQPIKGLLYEGVN